MFVDKIHDRKEDDMKNQVNLHGGEWKSEGLNTDGAIPIETLMDNGIGLGGI